MKRRTVIEGSIEFAIAQVQSGATKLRLLLHVCCGPCATSVLEHISPYFDISVFFYNPNIMPKEEFTRRLEALKVVVSHFENIKLILPEQNTVEYLSAIDGMQQLPEGGQRCSQCFSLRLGKTAEFLKLNRKDFDCFATTLTVSPHKNAPLINAIGQSLGEQNGVQYLCSDFKKQDGYLRSIQLCREWDIYRQSYCGCKFE